MHSLHHRVYACLLRRMLLSMCCRESFLTAVTCRLCGFHCHALVRAV